MPALRHIKLLLTFNRTDPANVILTGTETIVAEMGKHAQTWFPTTSVPLATVTVHIKTARDAEAAIKKDGAL